MNSDPIRLTYLVLDGNKIGAFGRLKIPYEPDYHYLVGLDLLDLLKEQINWDRRSQTVNLYKAGLAEQAANKLLDEYEQYMGQMPFPPVRPLARLNSYWNGPPLSDQVHLLVEILPGTK
ncbi:hypothetical protein FRC10_000440 [Ceratobasidium sp. 414]|nr:hypothetical protein FRC10_000440 [Ceratobasidium sp. 414]